MSVELIAKRPARTITLPTDAFRAEQLNDWSKRLPTRRRGLLLVAAVVLFGVFGLGGGWAATAKIGGAVSADGRVIAAGTNVVVQHLEGGIIKSIDVREGDVVERDQVLAVLDVTADQSQLHAVKVQQAMLTIELERWRAQNRIGSAVDVDISRFGDVADEARVQETLESQLAEFEASRDVTERRLSMLDAKIAAEEEDISSSGELLTAYQTQIDLVNDELGGLRELLADGLTTRSRVLALERGLAQLTAQYAQQEFTINKSRHNILSAQQEKEAALLEVKEEANKNITRVQSELNQLADMALRLEDRLSRAVIRSPVDGVVFRINFKSVGAVLPKGETFVEVFPRQKALAIETLLSPKDISEVKVGQAIDIVFASDHREILTPLSGTVEYVSTDTIVNPDTGESYYVVRSTVDAGQEERIILPGNQADVFFKTTPRTLVEYILEPITRFAFRTFKG